MRAIALVLLAAGLAAGCSDRGVNAYWSGYIVVEEASARRVAAGVPSTIRLDVTLGNVTTATVNNFHEARFTAGATSAVFDLITSPVGCYQPDPWDVPPGGSKPISMNVSFLVDPATLTVACEVEPTTGAFLSTHDYRALRMGNALPSDFVGPLSFDFRGTLDGLACTDDKCPSLVTVSDSIPIAVP